MDDAHIAAAGRADGVSILHLQLGHRLLNQVHRQLGRGVQARTAAHGGLNAVAHLRRVDHVGAAGQNVAHDGVHGAAALACQHAGGLHHVVVNGGHLHHVGQGHPAAVLVHLSGHRGHGQGLAFRGHTLGQGRGGLGQRVILAELDGLAVVGRDRVAVAELVMHQRRQRLVDEAALVKGLHLGAHAGAAGGVLQLLVRIRKQLQVQLLPFHGLVLLQRFMFSHPRVGSRYSVIFSPRRALRSRSSSWRRLMLATSTWVVTAPPGRVPFSPGLLARC